MNEVTSQTDDALIEAVLAQPPVDRRYDERQLAQINQALTTAVAQKHSEATQSWQHGVVFLALFVFLYIALGTSLTLDLSPVSAGHGHKSIAWALEAIPVLIAFSGYFISILYLFHCKTAASRTQSWDRAIRALETRSENNLFTTVNARSAGPSDYAGPAIATTLALFIVFTWLVMYNYLTFTTSGVMGSIISLFISTMTYVILDIQLLKPSKNHPAPEEPVKDEASPQEPPRDPE